MSSAFSIRPATVEDVSSILGFIKELAEYEELSHEVVADEASLTETLFGERAYAEVLLAFEYETAVGFALFFHNYSTFLAKPGIYLEDLYVKLAYRGMGYGKQLLQHVAATAVKRNCGRLEWSVLNWNEPSIQFYEALGAQPMDEWTIYRLTGDTLFNVAGVEKPEINLDNDADFEIMEIEVTEEMVSV
jgi:GNAT superfamily N-acetyltransferase